MTSPEIWVVKAAASRIMPAARFTLNAAQPRVAPVSLAIAFTKSSSLAASASATLKSAARRAFGPLSAHAGNASAALSATANASATVIAFALLAISLVMGFTRENVVTVIEELKWGSARRRAINASTQAAQRRPRNDVLNRTRRQKCR